MNRSHGALIAAATSLLGCVHGPSVAASDALALRRVVIYRNGVGYFERQGRVEDERVEFRVRQSEVGDFLATLAVMEQGGSSVRSAAFPMPREAPPTAPGSRPPPPPDPNERRPVRLQLDGRRHDLVVGYMVETPIWRPSYRLVFTNDGVQVQAWGIVQNLSGEDWSNVRLSLVAGAPVAFRSELAEPVISPRPLVTDRGEVIDAVPRGDTTLADDAVMAPPAMPSPPPSAQFAPASGSAGGERLAEQHRAYGGLAGRARRGPQASATSAPSRPMLAGDDSPAMSALEAPANRPMIPSAPRSVASLAAIAVQGGSTRYDLPSTVTVPDHSATMVMLASRTVPGSRLYLFAPDGGVPDSMAHPFQVARFENRTGAMLERGPLALFESGAFLGQGMLDPLPDGATATVPFSLERGIAVESSATSSVDGARLIRVARNNVTIERYSVTRTTFRARNGIDHAVRVLARLPLPSEGRLFQPPPGTEQSNGAALVPIAVPTHGQATVEVQTRVPFAMTSDWNDETLVPAVEAYLRDGHPPAATATALRTALDMRQQIMDLSRQRAALESQRNDLQQNTEETRANLLSLRRNPGAADLRARLATRLAEAATQVDQLTRRIVELDTQIGEKRVRLAEAVRTLDFDTTTSPPATH